MRLLFYIQPSLGKGQIDTAMIHVGINDLLCSNGGIEVLLQNILMIAARCKMHVINKIFVSSVLNAHKVSSDLIAKLNLHISSICNINGFSFIDHKILF